MARLLLTQGAEIIVRAKEASGFFSLDEMQAYCEGDIQIEGLNDGTYLVCNENGIAEGLSYNAAATVWVHTRGLPGNPVVGNALIATEDEIE